MQRQIVAKSITFESELGKEVFRNVPVYVDSDAITEKNFDEHIHDFYLSGDVIQKLGKMVAVSFLLRKNVSAELFTAKELSGIRMVLDLSQNEFADFIGVSKGTMSKLLKGTLKIKKPESLLCIARLGLILVYSLSPSKLKETLKFDQNIPIIEPEFIDDYSKIAA
jgi:DNA-binding transcriptional regulator YiaG